MIQNSLDALILTKVPYRERDMICTLLTREGTLLNVLFYGGQGGGKKRKSSLIELGHCLRLTLRPRRKKGSTEQLLIAEEWSIKWAHRFLRTHYKAFCVMCFYLDVTKWIAPQKNLEDGGEIAQNDLEHEGIFRVLSNALYQLDHSVEEKNFSFSLHLGLFLSKTLIHQGLSPENDFCPYCENKLSDLKTLALHFADGQFLCSECAWSSAGEELSKERSSSMSFHEREQEGLATMEASRFLSFAQGSKFSDWPQLEEKHLGAHRTLWHYFLYQFNAQEDHLSSAKGLF